MFRYLIYFYCCLIYFFCCYQIVIYTTNTCLHHYSRIEFDLISCLCSSFSLLYLPVGSSKSNAGTISRQGGYIKQYIGLVGSFLSFINILVIINEFQTYICMSWTILKFRFVITVLNVPYIEVLSKFILNVNYWQGYFPRLKLGQRVSEWLLLNANSAVCQLYYGKNKLIFNEMMIKSTFY